MEFRLQPYIIGKIIPIEINVKSLEVKAYVGKNKTKTGIITLPLLLAIYKKIKELK